MAAVRICVNRMVGSVGHVRNGVSHSHLHNLCKVSSSRTGVVAHTQCPQMTQVACINTFYREHEQYYRHDEEDYDDLPRPHSLRRKEFLTDNAKLKQGIWPWEKGIRARLPEHYKARYLERYTTEPIPVHYIPETEKYRRDMYGTLLRTQNDPIPVHYPLASENELWGGEGVVIGMRKRKNKPMKPRTPRIWKPQRVRKVVYSEILDQYMAITMTMRTLDLIDDSQGFDNYILDTHEVDLKSKLGMAIRREMIKALIHKTMYPDDPEKRDVIYERYMHHIIPEEEVEWLGLDIIEAEELQREKEEEEKERGAKPLKEMYAERFLQELKDNKIGSSDSGDSSWLSKLNPFVKEDKVKG